MKWQLINWSWWFWRCRLLSYCDTYLIEDYRLAYFINQQLPINLSKSKDEVQINIEGETSFSRFYYYTTTKMLFLGIWFKIKTRYLQENSTHKIYFRMYPWKFLKVYLLPEFKKADYFFKDWEHRRNHDSSKIKTLLNKIESISTVYSVDMNKIKSKKQFLIHMITNKKKKFDLHVVPEKY
jgi:hypothetical protein